MRKSFIEARKGLELGKTSTESTNGRATLRKVAQGFSRRAQGLQDQNGRCELGRAKLRKDFLGLRKA